jgi:hypothetical protein
VRRHFVRAWKDEASIDVVLGFDEQQQCFVVECTDYRNQHVFLSTKALNIELTRLALESAGVSIAPSIVEMVEIDRTRGFFDGSVHHLPNRSELYCYCIVDHPNELMLSLNQVLDRDPSGCAPVVFRPDQSPLGWSAVVYGQETQEGLAIRLVTAALEKGLIPGRAKTSLAAR